MWSKKPCRHANLNVSYSLFFYCSEPKESKFFNPFIILDSRSIFFCKDRVKQNLYLLVINKQNVELVCFI